MISMPQVQSIRRLRRNGESVASIARKTHVSEPTVRKYLAKEDLSAVPSVRKPRASVIDPYLPVIEQWLAAVSYTHLDVYKRQGFALIAIAPRQIRHIGEILHRVCRISGHRSIRMRNMLRRGCQPYSQGKQQADNGGQRDYGIHTPLPFLSPLTRLLTPPAGTSGFVATPIKQQWCIHEIPPHSVSVM